MKKSNKYIVSVIGDAEIKSDLQKEIAFEVGKLLVDNGFLVKSGGLRGVMSEAFKGAKSSEKAGDIDTIAILPGFNSSYANDYADVSIPTGMDLMRNVVVANSDAVIAIGGGAGTLSEIASAWALKRLVVAIDSVDGWAKELAGKRLDSRKRYSDIKDDRVYAASSAKEAVDIVINKIELYKTNYTGIK